MTHKPKTQALSIYLGKPSTTSVDDLIDASECKVHAVRLGDVGGMLYVPKSEPHPPGWVAFLQPGVSRPIDVTSMSASGVLAVEVDARWFAVVFGHGRHRLMPGAYEDGFGLRICLNCIEPNKVRSIDRRTFEDRVRLGREQVSRDSHIAAFGLDIERDMLRAVTGAPRKDAKLGSRISGMDSLQTRAAVDLAGLPAYLGKLLPLFASKRYRKDYPWVDHIAPVLDKAVVDDLDARLVEMLKMQGDKVWMAVPEIINWQTVHRFAHSLAKGAPKVEDLHVKSLLEYLYGRGVSVEALRQAKVYQFGANDQSLGHTWSAYDCLYAEVEKDGTFVLSGGRWYRVAGDYAEAVREAIAVIPTTKLALPDAKLDDREDAYNERASKALETGLLLDKKLVHLPRRVGGVEICDVLHRKSNTFVHVKKWGQSAVLSHLFAQGLVSADLFLHDAGFREEARKRIGGDWVPKDRPHADRYEVAFALISRSLKKIDLPFFSQVNLRACVERLQAFGYRVTLTKVQAK
jgi:uncharacterized protein (TIGR04141 family)